VNIYLFSFVEIFTFTPALPSGITDDTVKHWHLVTVAFRATYLCVSKTNSNGRHFLE